MGRVGDFLNNSYFVYVVLLMIIFGASGDLNLNIIKYVSVASLVCYVLISVYNKRMAKR